MINQKKKVGLMVVGLIMSVASFAQTGHELVGTWKEASTGSKLVLAADLTGAFSTENKSWAFQSSYLFWGTGPMYYLNYTIEAGGQPVSCYAIIKQVSGDTIRFISFLSDEMRTSATEETIDSGILLTKQAL